jgi:hypothetical protein
MAEREEDEMAEREEAEEERTSTTPLERI